MLMTKCSSSQPIDLSVVPACLRLYLSDSFLRLSKMSVMGVFMDLGTLTFSFKLRQLSGKFKLPHRSSFSYEILVFRSYKNFFFHVVKFLLSTSGTVELMTEWMAKTNANNFSILKICLFCLKFNDKNEH